MRGQQGRHCDHHKEEGIVVKSEDQVLDVEPLPADIKQGKYSRNNRHQNEICGRKPRNELVLYGTNIPRTWSANLFPEEVVE